MSVAIPTPRSRPELGIEAARLSKRFGATQALDGVDLVVPTGSVLGLLGPNGAGKTTAVRILATLLRADAGTARVAGFDVAHHGDMVRASIGLTGQYAAVDGYLTGRENLAMVGRLYHLPGRVARRRADELLERFDLVDAATRPAKTYSGGMRRRLDLAASLVINPPVLFLDEPTTGLDPRSRLAMWDVIAELVTAGTTLLLTTQYLDEADRLADRIAVIDAGRVIAEGTSDQLKARLGGDRLDLVIDRRHPIAQVARVLADFTEAGAAFDLELDAEFDAAEGRIVLPVRDGTGVVPEVVRRLDAAGVAIVDLAVRRPTLDDVFLALTGRPTTTEDVEKTDIADSPPRDDKAPAHTRSSR